MTDRAFVMWLDMLGYKSWLARQSDLAAAENILVDALRITFQTLRGEPSRLPELEIGVQLISDTIVAWSYKLESRTLLMFGVLYHVLATLLAKEGLPLRGAVALGGFRMRDSHPRVIRCGRSLRHARTDTGCFCRCRA